MSAYRPVRKDVACVIIAGGRATRMGGQVKALIQVNGQTILKRQLAVLLERFTTMAISANDPAPYARVRLPILADRRTDQGPLAGLEAALAWSPLPYVLAIASDMPYVSGPVLDLVSARRGPGVDIVVPYVGERPQPLCALYSRSVLPVLRERLAAGERRAADLMDDERLHVMPVPEHELRALDPKLETFVNINTPDDL